MKYQICMENINGGCYVSRSGQMAEVYFNIPMLTWQPDSFNIPQSVLVTGYGWEITPSTLNSLASGLHCPPLRGPSLFNPEIKT